MCGIAGLLVLGDGGIEVHDSILQSMAETLRHRGPDGLGSWSSPSGLCALAHTRLQIIDLATGDQPMPNEDGSIQVVFNGEIYNFRQLRERLERAGHRFRSRSDTEVLVHGYEEWGEDLPRHLEGMFAFGLWDERRRRLLLARDRAGQKPLFLYDDGRRFAFASELKALLALPGIDDTLDLDAFPLYLAYGYVPTPGTFYRRIRKLPPATTLVLGPEGQRRQMNYWSLDFSPTRLNQKHAIQAVREKMLGAVEKRLVSDVPLGAFLSGGIDSTIVVGLMAQLRNDPVKTFSIGMADDPNYDETGFAERVARKFGTDHTVFTLQAQEVGLLEELLSAYDEPFGDSSALPTYILSRLTREHVTVALSGDAGDELFAGYARFLGFVLSGRLPGFGQWMGEVVGRRLPHNDDFRSISRRFQRFFAAAGLPEEERMLQWVGFLPHGLDSLLRPEVRASFSRDQLLESFRGPLARNSSLSPLARVLALNFETYLLDDLLVKVDRCSMAHGLEVRSPFLDTALMEVAAGLPDRLRIRGGSLKHILKVAFPDLLPKEVVKRRKMGFGIPLPTWLRGHWRPLVEDRLLGADSALQSWIQPQAVRGLVERHMSGGADHGHQLWALLTLEGWLRRAKFSLPS